MKKLLGFLFLIIFPVGLNFSDAQKNRMTPDEITSDLIQFCSERRGFNLLGKFDVNWSNFGYTEKEFQMIQELGFNFVRLPLDYRTFTKSGDWNSFTESEMQKIDNAVLWGIKYGIHICINFHRAPGFCVNPSDLPANQQLNLWTDTAAQNAFIRHWAFFANRYKSTSSENLSFNLVNEPTQVTEEVYVPLMKKAIQTIHSYTSDRIIFVDGLEYGRVLQPALNDEPYVAQSIHCYDPFGLTHYKADWVDGSSAWPVPNWPMLWISSYLYGPWKSDLKSPLILEGDFPQGTEVIVNVRQVSIESNLTIKSGPTTLLNKKFICGPDTGSDFSQVVSTQWGYQNISNKNFAVTLPAASTKLTLENSSGDWMTLNSITIKKGDISRTYALSDDTWGKKQATFKIDPAGKITDADGNDLLPFNTYREALAVAKEHNIPLMVQEFGVYNKTPYPVTLSFLSDLVEFFHQNKIGWALWNFTGSFGILNSDRNDCVYENYNGYKLDRTLLDSLTRFKQLQNNEIQRISKVIKLYPTPAKNILYVAGMNRNTENMFYILDLNGKILQYKEPSDFFPNPLEIQLNNLSPGTYILAIWDGNELNTGKFQVQ